MDRIYISIDLKSFYASYECASRGLDPLNTHLVVADESRTEKTICLAVSPSLKEYKISGRARLFEVNERVREVNRDRLRRTRNKFFTGESYLKSELAKNPNLKLSFIIAKPRMAKYIEVSSKIYSIYLKYVSKEDIHVYSIDEVFIDVTNYLKTYKLTAHELAMKMIQDVLKETGITATAGVGTNLYLAKVAMDIVAKHIEADKDGVRIAELNEMTYREKLWNHTPITDFWRVGRGISERLKKYSIYTMGDLARFSLTKDEVLFKEFGINAELLIDHAWGYENVTIKDIKSYRPESTSISSGQVLSKPYSFDMGLTIIKEMTDLIVLDLVEKDLLTDQIILNIGYDISNLEDEYGYNGEVVNDYVGRRVPKGAHGSINLEKYTSSTKLIMDKTIELYKRIVNPRLSIRRLNIALVHTVDRRTYNDNANLQMDLFNERVDEEKEEELLEKENKLQKTVIEIHKKYGKNALLKGFNILEESTSKDRNDQIGGHKK